jgi:hypothetical protein
MRKGLYKGVCQTLDLIFVTLQPPNPKRGRGRERERERERDERRRMRDLGGFWVPVFKGGKPYTLSLVYFGIYTLFYFMFSFLLLIISVCV